MAIATASSTPCDLGEAGRALLAYWSGLPRPAHVPEREDFNPIELRRSLPVVSLTEAIEPGCWRIRLIGTEIRARAGRDLTGMNYLDLVAASEREALRRRLDTIVSHPCGGYRLRRQRRSSGLEYWVRCLSLPMRDHNGKIRLIIATNEEIGRALPAGPSVTDRSEDKVMLLSHGDGIWLDVGAGVPLS